MSYTGPGDIVTFQAWVGLRGYDAAYAAPGTNPCCDLLGADSATTTINILSSGDVDVASMAAFITAHGATTISKMYDQTGGGKDLTQVTAASQPALSLGVVNGHPCLSCSGGPHLFENTVSVAQPFALVGIAEWTGNLSGNNGIAGSSAAGDVRLDFRPTDLLWVYANGSPVTQAAVHGIFRRVQGVYNGASSFAYVDGVAGTSGNAGANSMTGWQIASDKNSDTLTGYIGEMGIIGPAQFPLSAGTQTSLDNNINNYWLVAAAPPSASAGILGLASSEW